MTAFKEEKGHLCPLASSDFGSFINVMRGIEPHAMADISDTIAGKNK